MDEKYGIIDIGSNTMRLVIYRLDKVGRFKEIENIKTVARLRNYVNEDQHLKDEGIKILIETLGYYQEIIAHHKVNNIKVVATATLRNVKNQTEILDRIKNTTIFNVRVLSEFEEANYGFLAVINSTSIEEGITIDIGGGSTEITYFKNRELIYYHSFPFGVLSLKNQFIKNEHLSSSELLLLDSYLRREFEVLGWLLNKNVPIIAIGGSARNVAQIHKNLTSYPLGGLHQYELSRGGIYQVEELLLSLKYEELSGVDGLSADRVDIITPAVVVFKVLYDLTNATSFILSRKGLRDGLFFEEMLRPFGINKFPNVLEESLSELGYEYEVSMTNSVQVTKLALVLLKGLRLNGHSWIGEERITEIKRAAYLFYCGRYIDKESSSEHTFYLIANRTIDGLMHKEKIRLAAIASFKSKSSFKRYLAPFQHWFEKDELKEMRIQGAVLKLAYALNITKRNVVNEIKMQEVDGNLQVYIVCDQSWLSERYYAEKQVKQLEKVLKQNVSIQFVYKK